jgi:hypothetical protein
MPHVLHLEEELSELIINRYSPEACDNADPADNPDFCDDPSWSASNMTTAMMDVTNMYDKTLVRISEVGEYDDI